MKLILAIISFFAIACNNTKSENVPHELNQRDEDQQQISQLKEENQKLQDEAAAKKNKEDEKNKRIIIQQIEDKQGLIITPKHDPIGFGGVNNGSFILENALSGIVFKTVTVVGTVYLANGSVYQSNSYTFTNLKPGDTRTRAIPNSGVKGKTLDVRVTEIQSNWLTNGQKISLE